MRETGGEERIGIVVFLMFFWKNQLEKDVVKISHLRRPRVRGDIVGR